MHWVLSVPYYFFSSVKFDKFYDTFLSPLHFTTNKTLNKPHSTADSHHSSRQKHREWKEVHRSGRWWRVMLHVHTCSGLNLIIPLMRRSNTDSAPNKLVMLPRNQLSTRYVVTSPVHTIRCYGTRERYKCGRTLMMTVLWRWDGLYLHRNCEHATVLWRRTVWYIGDKDSKNPVASSFTMQPQMFAFRKRSVTADRRCASVVETCGSSVKSCLSVTNHILWWTCAEVLSQNYEERLLDRSCRENQNTISC